MARSKKSVSAGGRKRSSAGGSVKPKRPRGVRGSITDARKAKRSGQLGLALSDLEEGHKIEVEDGVIQLIPELDFDWAQLLLSNLHPLQRNPRQSHVNAIARALTDGRYVFTGDSFKINQHDQLIDGQHRALAVLKANVPIKPALLMTIHNDQAYRYIDTVHKTRGNADIWRFMGHENSVPGTVFASIILEHSDFKPSNYRHLTRPEKYEIVKDYKFREEAVLLYKASPSRSRVPCGPLAGALRCMRKHKSLAVEFFSASFSNSHQVQGHFCGPAKLLATWILAAKMEKGKSAGEPFKLEGAEKAIRAWNAFREGRTLRKLTSGTTFPKPR